MSVYKCTVCKLRSFYVGFFPFRMDNNAEILIWTRKGATIYGRRKSFFTPHICLLLVYLYYTKTFCLLLCEKYFNHWMAAEVKNTLEFTGCHNHHRFKGLNMRYLCSPSRYVCILCRVRIFYFLTGSVCISACWKVCGCVSVCLCGIAITTYSECYTTR